MPRSRSNNNRLAVAAVLLAVVAASLAAVLVMLPERPSTEGARPERQAESRRPEGPMPEHRPPGDSPQPPEQPAEPGAGHDVATPPERPKRGGVIAVVIDDVGYSLDNLKEFLEFPGPIAFAVLPRLAYTRESARLVREAGKDLLLHLPMEPLNGDDPGPGAVLSSQTDAEIRRLVAENFADVEGAVGANNHMGSRATADPRVMDAVMGYLADTGRFFLDSRTTPRSAAAAAARKASVGFLERDVFIDNLTDAPSMRTAFDKGVEVAQAEGRAVLIGHIYNPGMLAVLGEVLAESESLGVRLVPLSELLERTEGRP